MKNHWTTRIAKKKAIGEINKLLARFVGQSSDPVEPLVMNLRKVVLAYFKANKEYVPYFLSSREDNRIDYRFDIKKHMGKVLSIKFKEVQH